MQDFDPLPCDLDKKIAHNLLMELAASDGQMVDVFSLLPACCNVHPWEYLQCFEERGYIEERKCRVFGATFTCYGITRLGVDFLRYISD